LEGQTYVGAPPLFVKPPGGHVFEKVIQDGRKLVTITRADGSIFAQARIDATGFAHDIGYDLGGGEWTHTWADPIPEEGQVTIRKLLTNCSSSSWAHLHGRIWATAKSWVFYAGSTPADLNVDNTEASFKRAHDQWKNNTNACGEPDLSSFTHTYAGRAFCQFQDDTTSCARFADVGAVCGNPNVLGCGQNWGGTQIRNGDFVLKKQTGLWVNGGAQGKWDVQGIAAHEVGHTIDFADVTGSCNVMTLPTCWTTNSMAGRDLGLGDAKGNNSKY
jgi:hypothetical protein